MPEPGTTPLFFLVAGEASGDLLGARLMKALKAKTAGNVRFAGVGGPRMKAEGIELLFDQAELAHMGLFELAQHVPHLLRRIHETARTVRIRRPAALITIDSPDFCFRVARKLKGRGIPLIHYVAPTVWAWRPGRAKKIARFLDHLLALLPFEPPYFTKHGLDCTFVGHPLVESAVGEGDEDRFRKKFGVPEEALVLTVLPGSRMGEVQRLLPIFKETIKALRKTHPDLHIVVPTVENVAAFVQAQISAWGVPVHFTDNDADKYDAFEASTAALACSGTVSVELAMASLPTVIAYRASPLTVALYRSFIKTKFVTLLNIMQDRMIMPEFLQENCTARKLTEALELLMTDDKARAEQMGELEGIGLWLGRGQFVPSEKAAETVWNVAFPAGQAPLRVLQIIPELGTGGAEQACVDVTRALTSRGDKAFVVSSGGRRVVQIGEAGGEHILRDVKTKNPFKIIRNAFWLADVIRSKKIDIVHARSRAPAWSAKLACLMTGRFFVTTFHAAYKFSCGLKKVYNSVMASADRVIAISPFIARHIRDSYDIPESVIHLANRGVDLRDFNPDELSEERKIEFRAQAKLGLDEKVILLPGRLSPIKGQDFFIGVVGMLKRRGIALPPVLLVGDDQGREAYSEKLRQLIKAEELEESVRMIGACKDMAAAYSAALLVVVPSKVPEGFGRVPVEAMAMGVPVIASNLGATQDTVLDGKTGILLPPDDLEAWARGVEKLLAMSEEARQTMAAMARAHVAAHFDSEAMTTEVLAVYDELMGRNF